MRNANVPSCCLTAFLFLGMQSLSEVAQKEEARRRLLEQQGIEGKVIEGEAAQWAPQASVSQWDVPASPRASSPAAETALPVSDRQYRQALQNLDKAIRQQEKLLETRRTRLEKLRRAPPGFGRSAARNAAAERVAQLQAAIEDAQEKIEELRRERAEKYEEGRKAGLLPGELDGKGVVP